MNLMDALLLLDPADDDVWTTTGLPRLEVVRDLVGNQDISRADIEAAAPGYSRTSRENPMPEPESEPETLESLQAKIETLMADKRGIEQQIAQATAEADALIDAAAETAGPQDSVRAIQDYLTRQKEILAQRGERMRQIRESGVDLKALAKSLKAPIDAAHTRRGA